MLRMSRHADRPPGNDADLEWCHEVVQGVSRTFALTVDVLDEPMASYICLGYLVCRIADTIEDAEAIPPQEQVRLLELYDRALDPEDETTMDDFREAVDPHLPAPDDRSDDWSVVANAPRIHRAFRALPDDVRDAVTPPARELVQGMAMFVERYADTGGLRIQSREELEEYCYYAAGTVGNLITNLVARGDIDTERRHRLYDTAEEFGLLLQLVNISKDVYDDYTTENNVYLPADWLADEGIPQDQVLEPEHAGGAAAVVRRTATYARSFLDDAQTYLETVPTNDADGNTLAAWAIPFLLAVGTIRELESNPAAVIEDGGVKVSREEVLAIRARFTDGTDPDIAALREQIRQAPLHRG